MSGDTVTSSVSFGQYNSSADFPDPNSMVIGSHAWATNNNGLDLAGLYIVRQGPLNVRLWSPVGGGGSVGGSGIGEFVFADFGTQDPTQGRYTSWTDLMAKLATIQLGAAPTVRLALQTGPFVVPLAGMPATGWDLRGGQITSFYGATGTVVLDCPAGVLFDNLFGIGGSALGEGAVVMKIAPAAGTSALNFTALPPGAPWIFVIGGGSYIDHSTGLGSLIVGDNTSRTCVLVSAASQQNTGLAPPLSAPLLLLGATDGAVGVQFGLAGLPDGWLGGGGPGSGLLDIHDATCNLNTDNIAAWIPAFTGGGGVSTISNTNSRYVNYSPSDLTDWVLPAPTTVQDALDRISAAVAGLLGAPIP